jgi:hypothetical protein
MPDVAVVPGTEVAGRRSVTSPPRGGAVPEVQSAAVAPEDGESDVSPTAPQAVWLHQLLSYDRWTLLVSAEHVDEQGLLALRAACDACPTPVQLLAVSAQQLPDTEELGRTDEYKLIRPDGYVALVAQLERVDVLSDYLGTFFAP